MSLPTACAIGADDTDGRSVRHFVNRVCNGVDTVGDLQVATKVQVFVCQELQESEAEPKPFRYAEPHEP